MARTQQIKQDQVPDGMVANCPWGFPMDQWSDRMIERGLRHMEDEPTEAMAFFPHTLVRLQEQARTRGLMLD